MFFLLNFNLFLFIKGIILLDNDMILLDLNYVLYEK